MFSSFRNRLVNLKNGAANKPQDDNSSQQAEQCRLKKPDRNEYGRPVFLNMTQDEVAACLSPLTRPINVPKPGATLPWDAGYAECTSLNHKKNEDQAAIGEIKLDHQMTIQQQDDLKFIAEDNLSVARIRGMYFGVFDGHGGEGAALMVADQLLNHIQEKLVNVQKEIFQLVLMEKRKREEQTCLPLEQDDPGSTTDDTQTSPPPSPNKFTSSACKLPSGLTLDDLIIGALESAFRAMDEHIGREKASFNISGGCCTLVALFICGKVYVANAGDCRAVAFIGNEVRPLSVDFKADRDMERMHTMAYFRPELLGNVFSMDRHIRMGHTGPLRLGERIWCKTPMSAGWISKEVTEEDIRVPLIVGRGKSSRLMQTIGICRSIGDHDLCIGDGPKKVAIKPFISCLPEVKVLNLQDCAVSDKDVLVMGSDGLWDIMNNVKAGELVRTITNEEGDKGNQMYRELARRLVLHVRGNSLPENRGWKTTAGKDASYDDITCLVVPLHNAANVTDVSFRDGHIFSQPSSSDSSS